jgi:hypothetical protein
MLDWNAVWMPEIVACEMAQPREHERTARPAKGSVRNRVSSFIKVLPPLPLLLIIGGMYVKLHG